MIPKNEILEKYFDHRLNATRFLIMTDNIVNGKQEFIWDYGFGGLVNKIYIDVDIVEKWKSETRVKMDLLNGRL